MFITNKGHELGVKKERIFGYLRVLKNEFLINPLKLFKSKLTLYF